MPVSPAALAAMLARETDEVPLVLVTIDHPSLDGTPIRVTSNDVATVSRGDTFQPFPFRVVFPSDSDDAPPRAQLEIDNVDQRIAVAIRSAIGDPPTVLAEVVLASQPNTVDTTAFDLELLNTEINRLTVRGDLGIEDPARRPYPGPIFGPAQYPGLAG